MGGIGWVGEIGWVGGIFQHTHLPSHILHTNPHTRTHFAHTFYPHTCVASLPQVKAPCHTLLSKLAATDPGAVLAAAERLVAPLQKTLTTRLKSDAVKQEVGRQAGAVGGGWAVVVAGGVGFGGWWWMVVGFGGWWVAGLARALLSVSHPARIARSPCPPTCPFPNACQPCNPTSLPSLPTHPPRPPDRPARGHAALLPALCGRPGARAGRRRQRRVPGVRVCVCVCVWACVCVCVCVCVGVCRHVRPPDTCRICRPGHPHRPVSVGLERAQG